MSSRSSGSRSLLSGYAPAIGRQIQRVVLRAKSLGCHTHLRGLLNVNHLRLLRCVTRRGSVYHRLVLCLLLRSVRLRF